MSRPTERAALTVIGALLVLRAIALFTHGVDSDEPQNLHVIYRWAAGDLPYRDVFDNHTPLFHFLFLPFAWIVGENPNVVVLARLTLIPLSFGSVALLYLLFRRLCDRRTALWSLAITLALADWALKSIELRPDILWMFLWFAALLALVRPAGTPRFFLAGLLLGASAAASVKTAFLLPALAIGWAGAWALSSDFRASFPWSAIIRRALAAVFGFAIVPGLVAAYFASQGALDEMLYSIYSINKDPFLTDRSWIFFVGLPFAIALTALLTREGTLRAAYQGAVFLTAAAYTLAIIGFGPYESLAKQTFLPAYPLLIAVACQFVFTIRPWRDWQINAIAGTTCLGLTLAMVIGSPPWQVGSAEQRALLTAVLAHTKPDDPVMDLKGETIFRRRPVHLIYVGNTTREMEAGNLAAPDPSRLATTGTGFAIERTSSFPAEMREFLRENYLSTTENQLRVAGKILKPSFESGKWIERLPIAIPGDYVIVENDVVTDTLTLVATPEHVFEFPDRPQRTLFWRSAWEDGLRPTKD